MTTPNPGSRAAIELGCTCPMMDNHYGRGYHGIAGEFVYTFGCPIHCPGDDVEFSVVPSDGSIANNGFTTIHIVPISQKQVRDWQDLPVWML